MVPQFRVMRRWFTAQSTIGQLEYEGSTLCFTLEDRIRRQQDEKGVWRRAWKVQGKTAIPAGTYGLIVDMSNRFQRLMPLVTGLPIADDGQPLYSGIRWHSGNKPADTDGCLLVGETRGLDRILGSVDAFSLVFPLVRSVCERSPGMIRVQYIDVDPPEELLRVA